MGFKDAGKQSCAPVSLLSHTDAVYCEVVAPCYTVCFHFQCLTEKATVCSDFTHEQFCSR